MAQIATKVSDKRMLKLIRAFLTAGGMEGGPLSPFLSNIVLDEFDRARYANDSTFMFAAGEPGNE